MAAHRTLRVVTEEYADFRFNTMVAHLMELANLLMRYRGTDAARAPAWDEAVRLLLRMLAPAAPHIAEELWARRLAAAGQPWSSIHVERWPEVDDTVLAEELREVPIQINGKLRDRVSVPAGISELELEQIVLARDRVRAALGEARAARIITPARPPRQRRRARMAASHPSDRVGQVEQATSTGSATRSNPSPVISGRCR
jgi:leucyl-tRNA synthetase